MKDWAGNEIKAGDTILWVVIKHFFPSEGFRILPDGTKQTIQFYDPDEKCWVPGHEKFVKEENGKLYTVMQIDEGEIRSPHTSLIGEAVWRDREILCIKGVSDNKEMYYKSQKG